MANNHWRSEKFRRLCSEVECLANIPEVCTGGPPTQAAHSNSYIHGKGAALKANDWYIAPICPACHRIIDSPSPRESVLYSTERRRDIWESAHLRFIALMLRRGHIVIDPKGNGDCAPP